LQVLVQREQQQKELEFYTELMKKFGPKDTSYAVLYSKEDSKYIKKLTKLNPGHLFLKFEEKWNDHNAILEIDGKRVEFTGISKADDIVTFPGLSYCMRLILGLSTTRYQYMCVGSDGRIADPFKQTLYAEAASRLDMSSSGTRARTSGKLQYIGNFAAGFQTITVRESAVNTVATVNTGIQFNRNMFSSVPITHVSGVSAFTVGSQFEFAGRDF
jgi:hypothetical protein